MQQKEEQSKNGEEVIQNSRTFNRDTEHKCQLELLLLTLLFATLIFSSCATAAEKGWEYRDWETSSLDESYVRFVTHGKNVHGHQFGFLVPMEDCDAKILWLSLSTYEKGLGEHLNEPVTFRLTIDDFKTDIALPLTALQPLTPLNDIALFIDTSVFTAELNDRLKRGKDVSFDIIAPKAIVEKFDITSETFSLSGFTANELKSREACKRGLSVLDIPPRVSKEQIKQEKLVLIKAAKKIPLPAANLIANPALCNDLDSPEYIKKITRLLKYGKAYTIHEHYMVTADSRDGGEFYPNIKIQNICEIHNPLPVVEIPGTSQQVFQLETDGNYLYALSNNHSVGGIYNEDDPGVLFQIIDIKNLDRAVVVGEYLFDGLDPRFKVSDKKAYIVEGNKLSILDLSTPSNITLDRSIQLHYERYGADDIALSEKHIFITGNSNLLVLDKISGDVQFNESFPFRTSDVIYRNSYVYIFGWGNNFKGSKIAIIDIGQPKPIVVDILGIQPRIFGMAVVENYLIDVEGKITFHFKPDGTLEQL